MAKRIFPQSRGAQMVALAQSSKEDDGNLISNIFIIMPKSLEPKSEFNKIVRLNLSGRVQSQQDTNLIKKFCMDKGLMKQTIGKNSKLIF